MALQLWLFLALVLDAYAIAAQTLVGAALGAGRPDDARHTAARVVRWGLGTGVVVAVLLLALRPVLPPLFTDDPAVLAQAVVVWWFLALMQPLAGVVFALDGVLMGAGDAALPAHRHPRVGAAGLPAAVAAVAAGSSWGLPRGVDRADPVHRAAAGRGRPAGAGQRLAGGESTSPANRGAVQPADEAGEEAGERRRRRRPCCWSTSRAG